MIDLAFGLNLLKRFSFNKSEKINAAFSEGAVLSAQVFSYGRESQLMIRIFVPTLFMVTSLLASANPLPNRAILDFEPNDSIDAAESIQLGREVDGSLSSMADADYYKLAIDKTAKLEVAFRSELSESNGWKYELLSQTGSVLGASFCDFTACQNGETLSVGVQSGTYFLKVLPESDSTNESFLPDGRYFFTITAVDDFGAVEFEPNNSVAASQVVELDKEYEGQLSGVSDEDYYKVPIDKTVKLEIAFRSELSESNGWKYELLNQTGSVLGASYCDFTACQNGETLSVGVQSGAYFLKVLPESDSTNESFLPDGNYLFKITAVEDFSRVEFEPNNSVEASQVVNFGKEYEGQLSGISDEDYYKVTIDETAKLKIAFRSELSESNGWKYELLNQAGGVLGASFCDFTACQNGETLSIGVQSGTYYLRVLPESDSINESFLPDGAYYFTMAADEDFSRVEFEPNNGIEASQIVDFNEEYEGQLSSMSDADYYEITIDKTAKLEIAFRSELSESNGWKYELLNQAGGVLGASFCDFTACQNGETLSIGIQSGTYFLRVLPESDSTNESFLPDGAYYFTIEFGDKDEDGIFDEDDNCLKTANPDQVDTDADGFGDACDADDDDDGTADTNDAFPQNANETVDSDGDGLGNNADADDDNDGVEDGSDAFPFDSEENSDADLDGVGDNTDAFPQDANESLDSDQDSVGDNADNCPELGNTEQINTDGDAAGDACDTDDDNDGVSDELDFYPLDSSRTKYGGQRALIIAGGGPYEGNFLWTATKNMANVAYDALRTQGLSDDNIEYLSEEVRATVDGLPTAANIKEAIENLAAVDEEKITDVLIYMVDHGDDGVFKIDESTFLVASDLKVWLDDLHAKHDIRSTLIYDACQSGSFIPLLASQDDTDRLVITSSAALQNAWFASDGYLSFSYYFWTIFRSGGDFSEATVAAKNAMGFQFAQTAKFDANGNGISDEKTDKLLIKDFAFGQGAVQASEFPVVGAIEVQRELNGELSVPIKVAAVGGGTVIEKVRVILTTPDKPIIPPDQPLVDLIDTELTANEDGSWSGLVSGFEAKGSYELSVIAESKSGLTSFPTEENTNSVTVQQKIGRDPIVEYDTDRDGVGDATDPDDDNDDVLDADDAFPTDPTESKDADSDGIGDNADPDDDNDALSDADELLLGTDPLNADSDSDGFSDSLDALPLNATESADTDSDGIGNNADQDDDGDGLSDVSEIQSGLNPLLTDSDSDGVEDGFDAFPLDADESIDTDNDGVGDNADKFPEDASETLDRDLDGVGDNSDAFDDDPFEAYDTDRDGLGNNEDPDDDNDGFSDADEVAAGTDPLSASSCPGCFSFDIDNDGEAKALTDGLLVIRHLFGFSGEALTAGAVGSGATRSTPADIATYLTNAATELDIDGDDEAKALTDGLLLIRQLFGFTGNALTAGAVGEAAERATASAIQTYIAQRLPDSIGSGGGSDDGGGLGSETGDAGDSGTDGSDTGVDSGGATSGGSTDGGSSDGGTDSGGDSGDTGGTDGGSAGTKNIEINVVYDRVPYCTSASCGSLGLDYAKTVQKPVRFAKAAVLDADSKQILTDNLRTDAAGRVSFSVAVDQAFIVRVYAESSGDGTASWGLRIVDNNGADQEGSYPLYVLESGAVNANAVTEAMTLQAESGWGLTKYTATRAAAPFAILDSMISATLYALSGRNSLVFAPVDVYWSVANTLGSVGTSYYSGAYIMILGDTEVDTDEYDESVIVHEWGHYFQSILSRDDSIGGNHGGGDLLDMRVAFSEGWANAYSGLATARDAYIDTSGSQQAGGFGISLETELTEGQGAVKGWYSEDSAQYLVYDLFDDGALDDDNVALPISAMMASLIDFMPQQAAATSIFSFSAGVINAQGNQSSLIMALLDREDIGRGRMQVDPIGTGETNSAKQYADVDNLEALTLPIFTVIDSSLVSTELCQDAASENALPDFGIDNKLGAYRFAQFEVTEAGDYTVRLVTTVKPEGATADPDFGIYNAAGLVGPELGDLGAQPSLESHTLQLAKGQYWAWVQDYNNYQRTGDSGRYCQRLEVVPQ